MPRVLFVCTGNICRSPMAAEVFRQLADAAVPAQRFAVDSAGIRSCHAGKSADPLARAAARSRGYDLSRHRARQIRASDFHGFDAIVGMGAWHVEQLRAVAPAARWPALCSLMDHAPGTGFDEVPDPHGRDPDAFEQALDLIELGCRGLLDALGASPDP